MASLAAKLADPISPASGRGRTAADADDYLVDGTGTWSMNFPN